MAQDIAFTLLRQFDLVPPGLTLQEVEELVSEFHNSPLEEVFSGGCEKSIQVRDENTGLMGEKKVIQARLGEEFIRFEMTSAGERALFIPPLWMWELTRDFDPRKTWSEIVEKCQYDIVIASSVPAGNRVPIIRPKGKENKLFDRIWKVFLEEVDLDGNSLLPTTHPFFPSLSLVLQWQLVYHMLDAMTDNKTARLDVALTGKEMESDMKSKREDICIDYGLMLLDHFVMCCLIECQIQCTMFLLSLSFMTPKYRQKFGKMLPEWVFDWPMENKRLVQLRDESALNYQLYRTRAESILKAWNLGFEDHFAQCQKDNEEQMKEKK